jgi:hypothetical protein
MNPVSLTAGRYNGGKDAKSITGDKPSITVKSTGASKDWLDTIVQLTYNNTAICKQKITILTPKEEFQGKIADEPWNNESGPGYQSLHSFIIKSQFPTVKLTAAIELNENWVEGPHNDYKEGANDWDYINPEAWMVDNPLEGEDTLSAQYGIGRKPLPKMPQNPLGGVAVYSWPGEHYVGSYDKKQGVKVLAKKWQYYQDHARRE